MYRTSELYMTEYLRAELILFVSGMMSTIAKYFHNKDGQFDVVKPPLLFTIYRKNCEIV